MAADAFIADRSNATSRPPRWAVAAAILATLAAGLASAGEAPRQRIVEATTALGYSDKTAELLRQMVVDWSDASGRVYFDAFARNLSTIEQGYGQGWVCRERLVQTQIETVRALSHCIENAIAYEADLFDLPQVLQVKKANCFGYAQLLCVLGNAAGLSVNVVAVSDANALSPTAGSAHVANIVDLADGSVVYVDLTRGLDCVSAPFTLQTETRIQEADVSVRSAAGRRTVSVLDEGMPLAETLIVWAQNRNGTPISFDSKHLDVLDANEVVAEIHFSRGTLANLAGRSDEAIGHYGKAIELSPRCARAYNNRGAVYLLTQDYEAALLDFSKAIEIDPYYMQAWQNRGSAYLGLGRYDEAIAQYGQAIELAPRLSDPLFCRGYARVQLGRYAQGIDDYAQAIALNPTSARIFYRRGIAYARIGDAERARADLARAVELDRSIADSVAEISGQFDLGLASE